MNSVSFASHGSESFLDVQLHYDHLSRTAHVCSKVFDGVLPAHYPSREAAADAARAMIARCAAQNGMDVPPYIRIWWR